MELFWYADADGDLEVNTGFDQTTAFYNLIKDAAETAEECGFRRVPVVQLQEGVYDFYSGYADTANGSGIPRSLPMIGAAGIRIRGAGQDRTLLRLHGKMQWLFAALCRDVTISDLSIEYADAMQFAPCTNPHHTRMRAVGSPFENDADTMLFFGCKRMRLERVRLFGHHLSMRFEHCEDITLQDVAGDLPITLVDCSGDFYGIDLCCPTVTKQREDGKLFVAKDFSWVTDAVLCEQAMQPFEHPTLKKREGFEPTILSMEDFV